jgi:hypothetical protein
MVDHSPINPFCPDMKVRVVEKVALDAPYLVVHLFPFRARDYEDLQGVHLQYAFAGVRRFSRRIGVIR